MQVQDKVDMGTARSENIFFRIFSNMPENLLRKKHRLVFLGILAFSALLRFHYFPQIPAGINVDEASAGYETYSLLTHDTDRWGNPFPVYFPAWGSG